MSYNQVNTPKFYLDAVLLARQWGMTENDMNSANFFHLNPSNLSPLVFDTNTYTSIRINFKKRQFLNSLSHCFVLGHNFASDSHTDAGGNIIAGVHYSIRGETGSESQEQPSRYSRWYREGFECSRRCRRRRSDSDEGQP